MKYFSNAARRHDSQTSFYRSIRFSFIALIGMVFLAVAQANETRSPIPATSLAPSDQGWIQALTQGRQDFKTLSTGTTIILLPESGVAQLANKRPNQAKDEIYLDTKGDSMKWTFTVKTDGTYFPFIIKKSGRGFGVVALDGNPLPWPADFKESFTRIPSKEPIKLAAGDHTVEISVPEGSRGGFFINAVALSSDSNLDQRCFDSGSALVNSFLRRQFAKNLWRDFPLQCDWFLQDNQVHGKWGGDFGADSRGDLAAYLAPDRDNSLENRLLTQVAKEIGSEMNATFPAGDPQWLAEYLKLCHQRRNVRLKPLAAAVPQIIYATHHNMGTIYLATETQGCPKGSELRLLDLTPLAQGEPIKDELLFDAKGGIVRDPEVSFDAKHLLFAWRKTNRDISTTGRCAPDTDNYKIYEMDLATRAVRALTTDETYGADFDPCYLPNGNIVFNSARCVQEITCGWGDCSNLYLMNKDGNYARRIGFDQTQTAFPHVLDDGRVIYTRRDYNDRGQTYAHALFVMNPDGTKQTEYYKNNSCEPTSLQHTRQIPGTTKTMSIAGGYHTDQGGKLVVIDVNKGRQECQGLTFFNWDPAKKITGGDKYGREGEQYIYPFPLDASGFLTGLDPVGGYMFNTEGRVESEKEHYHLYYMTMDGKREMLAAHPELSTAQSVPVIPRKLPPTRPDMVDYTKKTSVFYVQDVYSGLAVGGIQRGTIKKIRINELYYKPITIGSGIWEPPRNEVGPGKRYSSSGQDSATPVGVGSASFDAKGILGEVDVEEDGSAMFEVPSRVPVFFQLIDQNGNVAQTMRSWTTLMPGENFSCQGCHEAKDAPPISNSRRRIAAQKPPQKLKPFAGVSGKPFSYAKMIQPIWNRECISCHAPGKSMEKIDLSDTLVQDLSTARNQYTTKRKFYQSYLTLLKVGYRSDSDHRLDPGMPNDWVNYWTRLRTVELIPPYDAGSAKSQLITLLKAKHGKAKLTDDEINIVSAWIDMNVPFIGEYDEMNDWSEEEIARYKAKMDLRRKNEAIEQKNIQNLIKSGQ